ncbi:MAG TPA: pentapeptide repeat-containing protein [Methylomirabilota bacterium]|nr:pentapeptide repeat-containing protein [Methylomirabilota bacterium]
MFPKYLVNRTITLERSQRPSISDRLKAENDVRTILLQGLGALVLLAGAVTTWSQLQATLARNREELRLSREQMQVTSERNREELRLSLEGQVTERFTRAMEQLGSNTLAVRLGGIYALERIAKDSARDHGPIMEVLTAFVRERAGWKGDQPLAEGTQPQTLPTDIQAILTVIGRRVIDEQWKEPSRLELSKTDLRGAHLRGAHLENASLNGIAAKIMRTYVRQVDV